MQRILIRFTSAVWYCVLVILVLTAVLFALGRQFLPQIVEQQRPAVEEILRATTGLPISLQSLNGGWYQLGPVLVANSIEMDFPSGRQEIIKEIRLHLSLWESVQRGAPIFNEIQLSGIQLSLMQDEDGHWSVEGWQDVEFSSQDSSEVELPEMLRQPLIRLTDTEVSIASSRGQRAELTLPIIELALLGEEFRAGGELFVASEEDAFARFRVRGRLQSLTTGFDGELYLGWQVRDALDEYLNAYRWKGLQAANLEVQGRSWLTFEAGELLEAAGRLEVPSVQLRGEHTSYAPLEDLSGGFRWRRENGTAELLIHDLELSWLNHLWPASDYRIVYNQQAMQVTGSLANIGLVSDFALATHMLPEAGHAELLGYAPSGYLRSVAFELPFEEPEQWRLRTNLDGVEVQAFGGSPLGKGMDGYAELTADEGFVEIDSKRFVFGFPTLFLEHWEFSHTQMRVDWKILDDRVDVYSDAIRFDFAEGQGLYGAFTSILRDDGPGVEDSLSLLVGIDQLPVSYVPKLVPFYIVDEALYRWLSDALVKGQVVNGFYAGEGPLEDDSPEGSFVSIEYVELDDAVVKFDPGWPALQQVKGTVALQNADMDLALESASIAGMPLTRTQATLRQTKDGELLLKLDANAKPSTENVTYWLMDSPVSDATRPVARDFSYDGDFQTAISLALPFDDLEGGTNYRIDAEVSDLDIIHDRSGVSFVDLQGKVRIDSDGGVNAPDLSMAFAGAPAKAQIISGLRRGKRNTDIRIQGSLTPAAIEQLADIELPGEITGKTRVSANLNLLEGRDDGILTLQSDLAGVAFDYPAPLGKSAKDRWPLEIESRLAHESLQIDRFSVAGLMDGLFQYRNAEFDRGEIAINSEARVPAEKGLKISGKLPGIDLEAWQSHFARQKDQTSGWPEMISSVELTLEEIALAGYTFTNQTLAVSPGRDFLRWSLFGEDLQGEVAVPDEDGVIAIAMTRVNLRATPEAESAEPEEAGEEKLSPRDLPAADIRIDDLLLDGRSIGSWKTRMRPQGAGVVMQDIKGNIKGSEINGQLSWLEDDDTGHQTSVLTGRIDLANTADLSEALGRPAALSSESGQIVASLVWPGAPEDFEFARTSGTLDFRFDNGVFNQAKGPTSAIRFLGVLNTDAIARRLKMDFTDLYQPGVSYDRIDGGTRIENGVLTLTRPFAMQGPSSAFKITGQTNLVTEELDAEMVVVLPLTQNLPLAALVLGAAPVVGGALFVVDQLVGEPLSKLTSATYTLKGTWDKPDLKLRTVFDRAEKKPPREPVSRGREK